MLLFARNSVVNRQTIDLIGYREHHIQRGVRQQGYLIHGGDWTDT